MTTFIIFLLLFLLIGSNYYLYKQCQQHQEWITKIAQSLSDFTDNYNKAFKLEKLPEENNI